MKTLSNLFKASSILLVVLSLINLLLAITGHGQYVLFRFSMYFVTLGDLIIYLLLFILLFFFVALFIDKSNNKNMILATGAGVLGTILLFAVLPFSFILNQLPPQFIYDYVGEVLMFSALHSLRVILGFVLLIVGVAVAYSSFARKNNMMIPVIVVCIVQFIYIILTIIGIVIPNHGAFVLFGILDVALYSGYALMMFTYARNIDKAQADGTLPVA